MNHKSRWGVVGLILLWSLFIGPAPTQADSSVDHGIVDFDRGGDIPGLRNRLVKIHQDTRRALLRDHPELAEEPALLARVLSQAPLGALETHPDSKLRGSGLYLLEMGDLRPLEEGSSQMVGGARWLAWTESREDVVNDRARPGIGAWGLSDLIPTEFSALLQLKGWQGVFYRSSTDELQNGLSRGHIRANRSSGASPDDAWKTFVYWENGMPQTRDSNAGAWRNLEWSMQKIASEGKFRTINYGGVLWRDVQYSNLAGEIKTAKASMAKFADYKTKQFALPVPSAYWRMTLIVPTQDKEGRRLTLEQGLAYARPIATIIPNVQDADLFVSDWARFNVSPGELERVLNRRLPSVFDDILGDFKNAVDDGAGLPRETGLLDWKVDQLVELLEPNHTTVSKEAMAEARKMLEENNVDIEEVMRRRQLPKSVEMRNRKTKLRVRKERKSDIQAKSLKKYRLREKAGSAEQVRLAEERRGERPGSGLAKHSAPKDRRKRRR